MRRSPEDVEVATRLLGHEGEEARAVYEKLAARLSPLIGEAGVRALVTRSIKLSAREFAPLGQIAVEPFAEVPPVGDQLAAVLAGLPPEEASAASIALFGTLIGLLASLIGGPLVRQVLRRTFPALEHSIQKETQK